MTDILLLPGEVVSWQVTTGGGQNLDVRLRVVAGMVDVTLSGHGKPMRLVIGMYSGASLGGELDGPAACEDDDLPNNVMAVSLTGQALAVARCQVLPAGHHTFHLDAGQSAFYGYARLYDATCA